MCSFGVMPSMLHKDPFPEHKMLQYIHPSIPHGLGNFTLQVLPCNWTSKAKHRFPPHQKSSGS